MAENAKMEALSKQYKDACRERTKSQLGSLIDNFIDNDSIESDYKQKVIDMVATLLTLK